MSGQFELTDNFCHTGATKWTIWVNTNCSFCRLTISTLLRIKGATIHKHLSTKSIIKINFPLHSISINPYPCHQSLHFPPPHQTLLNSSCRFECYLYSSVVNTSSSTVCCLWYLPITRLIVVPWEATWSSHSKSLLGGGGAVSGQKCWL